MLIRPGKCLAWQITLVGVASLLAGQFGDVWNASLSALYGGAAALLNSGLLWWRWWSGGKRIHSDPGRHLRSFYRSSLERFFIVGIWLAVGFTIPCLQPLPMLSGFVVGQVAGILATLVQRERT